MNWPSPMSQQGGKKGGSRYIRAGPIETREKLQVLQTAAEWHAVFGYPGPAGPASDEVVNNFIIVDMMAKAATDHATPEEAIAWAQKEIEPIYRKWAARA